MVSAVIWLAAGAAALVPSKSWAARTASVRPGDRSQHLAPISSLVAKRSKGGRRGPPPQVLEQQRQQREYDNYMKAREESGVPYFDLFVRSPNSIWYPAGAMQGDDKAKGLVESYMGGFLSGLSKDGIDKSLANSVFKDKKKLVDAVIAQYPQLKKVRAKLEFGYKIAYPGLLEKRPEAKKVTVLTEEMTKTIIDSIKGAFGMG